MSSILEHSLEEIPRPAIESFLFGCELSSKTKRYTFEVDEEDECEHSLSLHTISLGADAKDEHNIIEVVARNYENKEITVPVANLKLSCQTMVNVEQFELQPPVTFCLKSGSGPVFLSGRHVIASSAFSEDDDEEEDDDDEEEDDDDDDDDDDEEEEEDEEVVAIKPVNKKMRK
ncbi:nucleoplasmin-3 [Pelobates cultripes]|uniref:Nucleoplasmin-3 n=1 Tax=Pelobates cultripes TaxID=61616 RepID=A0AAD1TB51_PELCU|nr:nucleoplasmin-3 [Pelobates cultripes]